MASQIVATRYELRERIGAGGVAVVYRAFDRRLERDVALKVLRSEYAQDQEFLTRFEREARTAAGLNHPNIVRVDDYGAFDSTFFIAMELVEGTNLKEHARVRGPLPTAEAVRIAQELLSALAAAHARGLVHRDVKPQNVLIDRSGAAKLTDFGIARLPSSTQLTQLGTTMGTAAYVAPEQAQGSVVGPAADLYGVGLLLYEMLAGRAPFDGDSPAAVMYRQVHEKPRALRDLNPNVPAALEQVVLRALEKQPDARYGSAEEMARALDDAAVAPVVVATPAMANTMRLPSMPPAAPTVGVAVAPPARPRRALPLPLLVGAAALAIGLALLLARPWAAAPDPARPTPAPSPAGTRPAGSVGAPTTGPGASAPAPITKPTAPTAPAAQPPTAAPNTAIPQPATKPTAASKPTQPAPIATAKPTEPPATPAAQPTTAAPAKPGATGGVALEDTAFQGGYRNPGGSVYRQRSATWVYGAQTPYAAMTASFELPAKPSEPARLVVVGLDSEDGPKTPISVSVNGVQLYSGPAPFENDTTSQDFVNGAAPWREQAWAIPPEALRAGANTVEIRSLADSGTVGAPPFFAVDAARVEIGR